MKYKIWCITPSKDLNDKSWNGWCNDNGPFDDLNSAYRKKESHWPDNSTSQYEVREYIK